MKRLISLAIVLGMILALSAYAIAQTPPAPSYGQLTIHYPDGDVITYLLPPEFPEMSEDKLQYHAFSCGYVALFYQEIGDTVYGIWVAGEEAIILVAGWRKDEIRKFWIYTNGVPSSESCSAEEANEHIKRVVRQLMIPDVTTECTGFAGSQGGCRFHINL